MRPCTVKIGVKYLFRQDVPHIFLTTEDPTYRYEWLCGHCGYPVEQDDPSCPRCQYDLGHCPACTLRTHRRPVASSRNSVTGAVQCSVCGVTRVGFGRVPLAELQGSFCTNLYGCPAGGLLLASDEFAVLPEHASLCPVCRNEELLPLDVRTFRYHLQRCVFCSTIFEREPAWKPGWSNHTRRLYTIGTGAADDHPCPMCGRNDYIDSEVSDDKVWIHVRDGEEDRREVVNRGEYLRLAELGRVLALYPEDREASAELLSLWLDAGARIPPKGQRITVAELFDLLLRGTVASATKRWVQPRIQGLGGSWQQKFNGIGEQYAVETGPPERARKRDGEEDTL